MGFKSKARKKRAAADAAAGRTVKDKKEEFEGQVRCSVAGCDNFADKKIGGRRLAFDRAADVWGEDGLEGQSRRFQSVIITESGRRLRRTIWTNGPER